MINSYVLTHFRIAIYNVCTNLIQANKMTGALIKSLGPLRPLVLVLKYFLARKGLCEAFTGGLSSYALLLITAKFLQVLY